MKIEIEIPQECEDEKAAFHRMLDKAFYDLLPKSSCRECREHTPMFRMARLIEGLESEIFALKAELNLRIPFEVSGQMEAENKRLKAL